MPGVADVGRGFHVSEWDAYFLLQQARGIRTADENRTVKRIQWYSVMLFIYYYISYYLSS